MSYPQALTQECAISWISKSIGVIHAAVGGPSEVRPELFCYFRAFWAPCTVVNRNPLFASAQPAVGTDVTPRDQLLVPGLGAMRRFQVDLVYGGGRPDVSGGIEAAGLRAGSANTELAIPETPVERLSGARGAMPAAAEVLRRWATLEPVQAPAPRRLL